VLESKSLLSGRFVLGDVSRKDCDFSFSVSKKIVDVEKRY
jgi:hypothetical protein